VTMRERGAARDVNGDPISNSPQRIPLLGDRGGGDLIPTVIKTRKI
jgi:hypothetical protein